VPVMSRAEAVLCRSAPWRLFARRVVLPWALSGHRLTGRVLEIGGGSGAMADTVLRTHPETTELTVVDLDPGMVRSAGRRLAPFGGRADAEVADVTSLPFDGDGFDVVLSFLMLHHVIDWRDALAEAARVLRPGGRLVGYDLCRSGPAVAFHRADRSAVSMITPDELRSGLEAVGLVPASVRRSRGGLVMRFDAHKPPPA
jgi:SAM-dependent methyltransferase